MTLVAFALAYAGLAALCFGMEQHYRQVRSSAPTTLTMTVLRAGGCAFLALSLSASVAGYPGSLGFVVWLGLLTATALPLAFLLPFAPRAVAVTAACAPILAATCALTSA